MVETASVVYCRECAILWGAQADEPDCVNPSHTHHASEMHRHRDVVTLPDGTTVAAVSFDPNDPYTRDEPPDFGLYLDPAWSPPWPHDHVDWPDFGVPTDTARFRSDLTQLLERSRNGERVEVGCLGAHGRTGTALACLAILTGVPSSDALEWVRATHCEKSVETPDQLAFISAFTS